MARQKINLSYLCSLKSGKLIAPSNRMREELAKLPDCENLVLVIKEEKISKTWEQIKCFHGPIVSQVQECHLEQDGEFLSLDKVKYRLKEQFLTKEKQYFSDGSPLTVKVPHPERANVWYEYHFSSVPSLADLSIEQFRSFIDEIISFYLHERSWSIVIEPKHPHQ
jgi:hypothetical protein